MHIVVCINYIPDPEAPAKQFRLDEATNRPVLSHAKPVIGPFDENAMELALQLKDAVGAKVTALTLGAASHQEVLRRALALRCDSAVHLKEERAVELDSDAVARLLAAAIRTLGGADLVLCGRQVGDWDGGQVGQILSEELGYGCVTLVREFQPAGEGALRAVREVSGGVALVEARLPAVATATNTAANQLRIPKVKDTMAAFRMPITTLTPAELGVDVAALLRDPACRVQRMFTPEVAGQVEMIGGDDDEQVAETLARRILSLKVI